MFNTYYSGAYNIAEFAAQNMAVIPLLAIALAAAIFRNRWVQIVCPILLSAVWVYYFSNLQDALK